LNSAGAAFRSSAFMIFTAAQGIPILGKPSAVIYILPSTRTMLATSHFCAKNNQEGATPWTSCY